MKNDSISTPPFKFETERLTLRKPSLDDAQHIFNEYAQNAKVTKYMNWLPHTSVETTQNFIGNCCQWWENGEEFSWVITHKTENTPIGMISLRINDFKAILGYVLSESYWNKGYISEAAKILINWALNQSEIHRVWAFCDIENPASAKVMEKVGMKREGILKRWALHPNLPNNPRDCICFAITK